MEKGYGSLLKIPGVDEHLATAMCEMGFFSAEEVSNADIEDLIEVEGIDEETATILINDAAQVIEEAIPDEEETSETGGDEALDTPEEKPEAEPGDDGQEIKE